MSSEPSSLDKKLASAVSVQGEFSSGKSNKEASDRFIFQTDAVTKEWFVSASVPGESARTYHVTVADFTSVSPDSPVIIIGVNGRRFQVDVHYGCSAYPLFGPPCSYVWEEDGHTFEIAMDTMSLTQSWQHSLLLFCDGREVNSGLRKAAFWVRRFGRRVLSGLVWLIIGCAVQFAFRYWAYGSTSHMQVTLWVVLFIGLLLFTTVLVLPLALGMSYLIVGCIGTFKFGTSLLCPSRETLDRRPNTKNISISFTRPTRYQKLENCDAVDV